MNVLRFPAILWMAIVTPAVQLVSAWILHLTDEQQGVLNGLAAAVLGFVAMLGMDRDRALAGLGGVVQALIALGLAFGVELDPSAQSAILALVAGAVAFFVHTQVAAKIPAEPVTPRAVA